jgi:hypothetical protein
LPEEVLSHCGLPEEVVFCTLENLGFSVFVFFVVVDGLWVPICRRMLRGNAVVATAVAITLVYSKELDT